jgi:aryl-alcohol dehydrogenase
VTSALAAVLTNSGDSEFELRDIELGELRADEVLVRIEASGVCHTDLVLRGMVERPCVLGHEGTGIIEAVGADVTDVEVGDCVVLSYASCGVCGSCTHSAPNLCENNFELSFTGYRSDGTTVATLDGSPLRASIFQQSSFSTHVIAPARSAVVVPHEVPAEVRAALTCSVFTGAGVVARQLSLQSGDRLLVFGGGVVGLSAVMAAHVIGVRTVLVDPLQGRRELAKALGAFAVLDPLADDCSEQLREHAPGGFLYVLDTSGVAGAWELAIQSLAMGGRFLFVTVPQPMDAAVLPALELMKRGAGAQAVIQGGARPQDFLPQLLRWYAAGEFPVDRLITTYPFHDVNLAIEDMASHKVIKPVLVMA